MFERRTLFSGSGFDPPTSYATTGAPDFVIQADLDEDGNADTVISSYDAGMLSVRLGSGNGSLQSASNIPLSTPPDYVAASDLNGDTHLDLIVAQFDTDSVAVLLGNGDGTFQAATTYDAGVGPRAFAIADYSGDGFADLVLARTFEKQLTVLRGNGDGTFQAPLHASINITPTVVIAGDFDGDGKADIAASDFYQDKVTIFRGNGDATFQAGVSFNVGTGPSDLAVGDVNGDGKLDLITANLLSNNVSVLRGNGNGTFQTAFNFAAGAGATFVAIADFSSDSIPDLAVADANADKVSILRGNGTGSFTIDSAYDVGQSPRAIAVANLNGDDFSDLIVTNQDSNSISVLIGTPPAGGPTADAGGPYDVTENGTVQLNGLASTGTGLVYEWDLDADGVFGETGSAATRGNERLNKPTFSANGLDGPSSYDVSLRVTDNQGRIGFAAGTISVNNVAPTLTLRGTNNAAVGIPYMLLMSTTDPGTDTVVSWLIDWGDGTTQTVSGNPSGKTHIYQSATNLTITATATDEDGTYSSNAKGITVLLNDTVRPTATASLGNVSSPGGTLYSFTVTYTDNVGINTAMLDDNDLVVTGPNGFSQGAQYVSRSYTNDGAIVARYQFVPPDGSWDWPDTGTYTIAMQTSQVRDTTGNSITARGLATFQVGIYPADAAGNDIGGALNWGGFSPGRVRAVDDFVGAIDRNDYVKFSISTPLLLVGKLYNLTANADMTLLDAQGNRLVYCKNAGSAAESFTRALNPGTYYIRALFAGAGGTFDRLRLEAKVIVGAARPGDNTLATARSIGTIQPGSARAFDDFVGPTDRHDLYRFTVDQPLDVDMMLSGMASNCDLQLLDETGQRMAYSKHAGSADERLEATLQPGTYLARVLWADGTATPYHLIIRHNAPFVGAFGAAA